MRYQLWFISMYPCKWTKNIRPTYCKSPDSCNPLQLSVVQLYTAGLSLNWRCQLTVTHSILTCSSRYNLQHFPLLFVIIFLTFPQQQAMAPETLQPGALGAESSRTTGAWSNTPPVETQQQRRHQLVHCDAAIVATENMAQDAHLKTVCKTGSNKNKKQHAFRWESIHVSVDDGQLTI